MNKRIVCMLLAAVFLMGQLPAAAVHTEQHTPISGSVTVQNPLYADKTDTPAWEDDSAAHRASAYSVQNEKRYENTRDAGAFVRSQIANRQPIIVLSYQNVAKEDEKVRIVKDIVEQAFAETGNPNEGDYLRWQYGRYVCNIEGDWISNSNGTRTYTYKFIYTFTYYTTPTQEREFNEKLDEVLEQLDLEHKTPYHKIHKIYEYITQNVTYEYDDESNERYTAYRALVKGSAVCQGYALLLYRMLREEGISARVIAGTATSTGANHAWNIVQFGDHYYYLDSTWDAGAPTNWYDYFMRGQNGFTGHEAWEAYQTETFQKQHPVAQDSYEPTETDMPQLKWKDFGTCGKDIAWTLSRDGVLTLRGHGAMNDSIIGEAPWQQYTDSIRAVDVGYGITSIGAYAFYACHALHTPVVLPDTVTRIGQGAFLQCTALPSVDVMPQTDQIALDAFAGQIVIRGCEGSRAQRLAEQVPHTFEVIQPIMPEMITLSQNSYTYTGQELKPQVTVTGADSWTADYENNVCAGAAYAVVSASGPYGGKTAVPFTILKAVPQVHAPEGLCALHGQSLKEILLPGSFAWEDADQSVGEAGEKTFYLTYMPTDGHDYESVAHVPVKVRVFNTIRLSHAHTTTYVGAVFRLIPRAFPDNAPQESLTWSSENDRIASAAPDGKITGHSVGTTTIHVRSANGEQESCTVTVEPFPFTDVRAKDWFYHAVSYTAAKGTFAGDGPQVFHPNRNMSRAMLVQVLYQLEGKPAVVPAKTFDDVKPGEWYTDAVNWAVHHGIASGTGPHTFAPNAAITREQTATMLQQYADMKNYPTTAYVSLSSYDDDQHISGWAIHAMQWAVGNGLLSGMGNNTLQPRGYATRAQVAQIMMQFDYTFTYG